MDMRTEKSKAIALRLKGKSYSEIGLALKVPRATLSQWLATIPLSPRAQRRIDKKSHDSRTQLRRANQQRSTEAAQRAHASRSAAAQTINHLSFRDLMIAGTMLYWAEGYKKPIAQGGQTRTFHPVRITTGDPDLIGLFSRFLHIVCGVHTGDIRINLRIGNPADTARQTTLFARSANIPLSQIKATIRKPSSVSKNLPPRTIAELVVNNTALYHTIMGFIDGLMRAR